MWCRKMTVLGIYLFFFFWLPVNSRFFMFYEFLNYAFDCEWSMARMPWNEMIWFLQYRRESGLNPFNIVRRVSSSPVSFTEKELSHTIFYLLRPDVCTGRPWINIVYWILLSKEYCNIKKLIHIIIIHGVNKGYRYKGR